MTDQELTEILAHPRVRAYIIRVATDAARLTVVQLPRDHVQSAIVKAAARGDLNYRDAAAYIGCPYNSVRAYIHRGQLQRGKLHHTVTVASAKEFKRSYRPKKKS